MILFYFRFIQEKRENTDQRAEGIESRVGRGSSSHLRHSQSWNSLNLNPASSHAGSCTPSRGRSKPRRRRHSPAQEVSKLGFMSVVCVGLLLAESLPEHIGFLLFVFSLLTQKKIRYICYAQRSKILKTA